ncbi:hypothetical protein [Paractinoplanes atraurantiacus]|uniref:Uncharacterized protein n=1 Tax=Paractinoplanes atraurantiacus TaxID=1036182 RepID=A0A285KLZ4_9ACTN|nr:hypothetical protein [Actinoplanes atraurantiacus]SNY72897.1 hypothetical protein SAMN05421748_14447 [Actinoplanes atraurantiacus]
MTDSTARRHQVWWQTVDFRPAPPGWRVVSLFGDRRDVLPMPGWLIQERYLIDEHGQVVAEPGDGVRGRQRRIAPGVTVGAFHWCVEPTDENMPEVDSTWMILAPGQPEPSEEDQVAEVQRRTEAAAQRAAARKAG